MSHHERLLTDVSVAIRPAFRVAPIGVRYLSAPTPEQKATSIIDALPGNSIVTKTGALLTGTAAAVYGISNEFLLMNDEVILVGTFVAFGSIIAKIMAPAYKEWADGQVKHVSDVLNASRAKHVSSVTERISSVSQLSDVVSTTKQLFAISKETVELEAKAFELKQKVTFAAEAKSVLDSWVRYEASVRQLEQEQLAKTIIEKVNKEVTNPKFQERVLAESVAEIEKLFAAAK
ncbi:hypothetical protein BABINDRAFT_55632 [Babjeviella inositovora NRRL Y-12698]|uniref:ATP synthase subunit 4 n=1 Tax=Babjeviella inositovora NRRL Y-12698 TaxID=984486 RepID=A0A1E3QX23_9ASCO|nr:uncharacterized protein BABINDRAFT_55632 [Babjeviella inositovora NRRL Y-12698]ODQ82200.1 hypothetical protein BABINDRAFT_55632 [Babjeviella inositovora NRRL Y-12698]